jgi:hypothetical protein
MCSTLTNSSNLASISASKRSFPQIHQSMTFVVPEPQAPLKLSAVAQLSSNPQADQAATHKFGCWSVRQPSSQASGFED